MQDNKEEKKVQLFREKSLEAIESPEVLNDYLKVTSPGVWLVLGAVMALLIGALLWGIFGRISTGVNVAVLSQDGESVCVVPYETLPDVIAAGEVQVNGAVYAIGESALAKTLVVSEETSPYLRMAASLSIGDVAVEIPITAGLEDGIYTGSVTTETIRPLSLLLQ